MQRINYDEHGVFLGEFQNDDSILVVLPNGEFYLTDFDANNHYEPNMLRIEKFDANKVWTAVLYDADNGGMPYVKRFLMEAMTKHQNFLGENPKSQLLLLTDTVYPRLEIAFAEPDAFRGPQEIEVEEFIAVKGFKAKGKRLTTFLLQSVTELEPTRMPEVDDEKAEEEEDASEETEDTVDSGESDDSGKSGQDGESCQDGTPEASAPLREKSDDEIRDELTGQLRLF